MLINSVNEQEAKTYVKENVGDDSEEYQTANEYFGIMTKNLTNTFDVLENTSLTERDLVILYENIDLGTKLDINHDDLNHKASNQYVETIIYNDDLDSEDSDAYEIYSNEDLHNVFNINHERMDFFNSMPCQNNVCQKFGNIQIKSSDLTNEYDKYFLLNDLYIKKQLRSLHAMSDSKRSDSTVLPVSLLDYICSKRFGDNYNFYMDSIIERVQHTIEQLKRISNGDYLTERAKARWKETENVSQMKITKPNKNNDVASATKVSLPIQGKLYRQKNIWDIIVRSEMDVSYLTKILHKKIILAVPKMLRGSFGLFNKPFKDIFSMSCKAKNPVTIEGKEESKVDHVILKLKGSVSNVSDINPVMVVKPLATPITNTEYCESNIVTIRLKEFEHNKGKKVKIIELDDQGNVILPEETSRQNNSETVKETDEDIASSGNIIFDSDVHYSLSGSYELGQSMQRLNIQSPVFEESEDFSTKKKSPTRVRIKSPYENKSYIIEENKRKKLLEIREKREKKKIAMNENCKVTKHKYAKGAIMAQSSNSVTKLSITNKSFYNSIYGQTNKLIKNVNKVQKREISELEINEYDIYEAKNDSPILTAGKNDQKYINRSYYLDEADTEVMYLQMKPNNNGDGTKEMLTPSTSILSNDIGANYVLKHFINPSTTDFSGTDTTSSLQQNLLKDDSIQDANKHNECTIYKSNAQTLVPSNTPKQENKQVDKNKKNTIPVECRKSIDKIYNLLKKINVENIPGKGGINNANENTDTQNDSQNIIVQESDCEISIRHPLTSSNPSSFSLDKANLIKPDATLKKCVNKKTLVLTSVVPKVIINSKTQVGKSDNQKTKKETKKVDFKNSDNPLKAISQLLHEFDYIQKTRYKNGNESKSYRKIDNLNTEDKKTREFRLTNRNTKHVEVGSSKFSRQISSPLVVSKNSQQNPRDEKFTHKKNISDMIDEAKEMRGEAVRGPSKRSSRIDNLAQPKRSYVKAHNEDFQNKYNRNPIPKVIKPVNNLQTIPEKNTRNNCRNKLQVGAETPIASAKQPYKIGPSIEKIAKIKRSANSSPTGIEKRLPPPVSRASYTYNVSNTPDPFDKKMVAVETYLKHHFGQPTLNRGDKPLVHMARVPLIPNDIDLASMTSSPIAEESTTLGNKLHDMIHSKINTNDLALTALTEYKESVSKTDIPYKDKFDSVEQLANCGTITSNSEFAVDIFEDKNIVTAVACVCEEDNDNKLDADQKLQIDNMLSDDNKRDDDNELHPENKLSDDHKLDDDHKLVGDHKRDSDHKLDYDDKLDDNQKLGDDHKLTQKQNGEGDDESKYEMQKCSSDNELQKLENALYHKISSGTFHKRLRIKKLTLTPKSSMQNILVLQSGDARSLIVKSTLSQNIKLSETKTVSKLNILPVMSIDAINWNLPMQIATVGYVFPSYKSLKNKNILDNKIKLEPDSEISSFKSSVFKNKTVQCYKGLCNSYSCLNHNTNTYDENHITNIKMLCSYKTNEPKPEECIVQKELFHSLINDKIPQKEVNDQDNQSENIKKFNSDVVSNSTSLDMLVGLLNEIKKITTCQSNLVSSRKETHSYNDSTELKVILNKAAARENSTDHSLKTSISISSFDSLRQVHSSNFSFRIPSDSDAIGENFFGRDLTNNLSLAQPLFIDKEVNVQISSKELVHRFTDVPSRFFLHTTDHSTDVLRSLMSVVKRTSSESFCSFSSTRTLHSSSALNEITVFQFIKNTNSQTSQSEIKHFEQKGVDEVINLEVTTLSANEIDKNNVLKRQTCNGVAVLPEFDPMIKMKRDVLVTVYSILVITVFAALTIPEIMFYS